MFTGRAESRRGASLVELLVCSGLLGLLMLGVLAVMVANNQYLRNSELRLDMQREALQSLGQMTRELTESNRYAINVEPDAMVFASPRDMSSRITFDSRGRLQWHKYVCYYRDPDFAGSGTACLVRKVLPLPTPAIDVPPAPSVSSVRDNPGLTPKVVAHYVESFTPELTPAGPVQLSVLVKHNHYGKIHGLEIRSKVFVRN